MALRSKVGSFSVGTGAAGTTVAVSGFGFTPKAVILFWGGLTGTGDSVGGGNHFRGMGFAVSNASRCAVGNYSQDGAGTSITSRSMREDCCVIKMTGSDTIDGLMDVQSFDSDGITFVVDDQFTIDMRVHYIAIGGSGITNAAIGRFQEAAATGNQDVTGVGFQPDTLFLLGVGSASAPPFAGSAAAGLIFGAANAAAQFVLSNGDIDNQGTMITGSYLYDGEIYAFTSASTTVAPRGAFSQFLADGFRINWLEKDATQRQVLYLALKGGANTIKLGTLTTRTDGNAITVTGLGFRPTGVLFASHTKALNAQDTASADDKWSMGAASGPSDRAAAGTRSLHNAGTSVVSRAVEHDSVYVRLDGSDGIDGLMDLTSLDADGFSCVMDNADPDAAAVAYVAFGNREITAAQGSITLSGQANTLDRTYRAVGGQGSYSLAGQAAALQTDWNLGGAQGSYSLTGEDADLVQEAPAAIVAQVGEYAQDGQDAGLLRDSIVEPAHGEYDVAGQDVGGIQDRIVSATDGAYALSGQDAGLSVAQPPHAAALLVGA